MKKALVNLSIIIILLFSQQNFAYSEVFRVAGDSQFPPYEYVDTDGTFKGFNVDMLKAISLVTGMEFEFIPMKWEDAYHSIERGQADIIQGMKVSDSRKYQFLFTDSLLLNSQSIFVLDENNTIFDKHDLKNKVIALNKEDVIYQEIIKIENVEIVLYDTLEEALQSLLDKDVDALIGNTLTVNYICKEMDAIQLVKIVGNSLNEQKYSIAVDIDNEMLLSKLNSGINELQQNGMYDSLYRKWFGAPIKNTRKQYENLLKITIGISCVLAIWGILKQSVNNKLKKIIETKTEEQKALINELRHYDKLQFMDKIISSIAHEVRNPLTSIKLYTSQLKNKIDNKDFILAAAEDIPEEIDRIDGLIKEFMEYSSPRKPLIEDVNLYDEIIKTVKLFKMQVKNIKLIYNIDKEYYIKFDVSQFKQVVLNILLNSKDAVKDVEAPVIEIQAIESDDEIIVSFKDNGYGMDKENLKFIFEPFYTTKEYGNGVGMFVVKQIVEENDGVIMAESHGEQRGMKIILKVKRGEANEEQATNSR